MIKAGDLVMVVKGRECSCSDKFCALGEVFTVSAIVTDRLLCADCGHITQELSAATDYLDGSACATNRLIKIDPPALPETIAKDEEITA